MNWEGGRYEIGAHVRQDAGEHLTSVSALPSSTFPMAGDMATGIPFFVQSLRPYRLARSRNIGKLLK